MEGKNKYDNNDKQYKYYMLPPDTHIWIYLFNVL